MNELNIIEVEKIFKQINDISETKEALRRLQMEYNVLITPVLNDISLIPAIYEWYKEISIDTDINNRDSRTVFMQCFIFIVVLFYSPQSLVGGKLLIGIREKLAILLQYNSPTSISNVIPNLMFFYNNYQSYRDRINTAFEYISDKLKSHKKL